MLRVRMCKLNTDFALQNLRLHYCVTTKELLSRLQDSKFSSFARLTQSYLVSNCLHTYLKIYSNIIIVVLK